MVAIMYAAAALAALATLAGAVPTKPETSCGSATATSAASTSTGTGTSTADVLAIERAADGPVSNAPPPAKLNSSSIPIFQVIAFNENLEVEFFKELLANVTTEKSGYKTHRKDALIKILTVILAQEQLHALVASQTIAHFGGFVPTPCKYSFPVNTLKDAITLISTLTDVVLGTLQDAEQGFATNGDFGPVRAIASVIGNEGEQNGWFRNFLDLVPSQKPFLTTSVAPFAFSGLQAFVVPNSCPYDLAKIPVPIFAPLAVTSGNGGLDVKPADQSLSFAVDLTAVAAAKGYIGGDGKGLFITYLTGQQVPVSEPVKNLKWSGSKVTFDAFFPFEDNIAVGLSLAALTTSGNFSDPDSVPAATLAAPGIIEVNHRIR